MKEVTNARCCFLCRNQTPSSWVWLAVCYFNNAKSNISKVSNVIVDGYGWFKWKMSHVELLSCNTNYSISLDNTWAITGSTEESQTWREKKKHGDRWTTQDIFLYPTSLSSLKLDSWVHFSKSIQSSILTELFLAMAGTIAEAVYSCLRSKSLYLKIITESSNN